MKAFYVFSLPHIFFKYHFNQSFDNYETCQLIVRIHQMCHKWQEMRTWILKLDGLQKSLTITAINHPATSIFGWRRLCRQQKNARQKLTQKRGAIFWVGKDGTLVSGLYLEFKRWQLGRCYGKRHPRPLSQWRKHMEVFPFTANETAVKSTRQSSWDPHWLC